MKIDTAQSVACDLDQVRTSGDSGALQVTTGAAPAELFSLAAGTTTSNSTAWITRIGIHSKASELPICTWFILHLFFSLYSFTPLNNFLYEGGRLKKGGGAKKHLKRPLIHSISTSASST